MAMRVETRFTARDQSLNKTIKRNTQAMTLFGRRSTAALNRTSAAMNRVSRTSGRLSGMMKGIIGYFSVRQILNWSNESIKAFQKQEMAIENVRAGLKSTGGTVGRTLENITKQASSLQKNTFFGDEDILQGVSAQLLTFTNIQGRAFDRTQKAVLDVTAKLKGLDAGETDLRATSIMLGKALNDPVANLGALGRAGIQFSKEQKALIKTLTLSGKGLQAQEIILTELEKQYGGTAEALAKSAGGIEKSLKNQIGDAMELVGKELLPIKLQLLNLLKALLPYVPLLIKLAPYILAAVAAWKAYAIVQGMVNVVMTANPVGAVIVGLAALIALIAVSIKNWDKFGAVMIKVIKFMLPGLSFLLKIIEVIMIFKNRWQDVVNAFKTGGILGAIKMIGKVILDAILLPIQQILNLIAKIPGIGKFAKKGAVAIQGFRENSLGARRESPNKNQVASESGSYRADINFNNMPAGTKVKEKRRGSGAKKFNYNYLGAN